jgi:hypothetical protein
VIACGGVYGLTGDNVGDGGAVGASYSMVEVEVELELLSGESRPRTERLRCYICLGSNIQQCGPELFALPRR